jgi:hypothetical protein
MFWMLLQIVDVKKFPLGDEDIRRLAEIETHPRVMKWDMDIHTTDVNEMYCLFKEFLEGLPSNEDQIFLVGRFNNISDRFSWDSS